MRVFETLGKELEVAKMGIGDGVHNNQQNNRGKD